MSVEGRATSLWSAATSTAGLCKRCNPLFTDGVYVSVKAGASSGAVFLTPWMEKLDAAGKLGVEAGSGFFKLAG